MHPPDGAPLDFTLVEHTQTPLGGLEEHGAAADRLEARLDELLALSDWQTPRIVHATRTVRGDVAGGGEEVTWRAEIADDATGGTALIELVRGAAVRWQSGWSLRTAAGAYHEGVLATREPGGELAARPWTEPASSPLDALHAWVARGERWPVTAAHAAAVARFMNTL